MDACLYELLKAGRGVTACGALYPAEELGTSVKLWMNLRATRDLAQGERRRRVA